MSGLNKFQDSEAWRQKLRDHLLANRVPKKSAQMESKEQRYSLDIDEDLKKLLEARKLKKEQQQKQAEAATTINMGDDTIYESMATGDASEHGDDSFDAFERMCDKTASDPDSTLFQYLHSEDKKHVLAMAKENSGIRDLSGEDTAQKEIEFLRRMLEQIGSEDHLDNESPVKGVECTQLEDVEAPSRFWDSDQTLACSEDSNPEPMAKKNVSPVKMVGLLRPSTIIEAYEQESDVSSHVSFQSAQTQKTNVSSSYETATESSSIGGTLLNVDDLFYAAIKKAKPLNMSKEEERELLGDLHGSLIELASPSKNDDESDYVENTIIELSSSDEEEGISNDKAPIFDIKEEAFADEAEENKENSMHFNDTIEEIQYMMQKGLEYIAAAAPVPATVAKPKSPVLQKQNTFDMSPKRLLKTAAAEFLQPPVPLRSNNKPQNVMQSPSKSKIPPRYDINMHLKKTPHTFLNTPSGIPQRRQRQLKQPYDDIISPIRTYTQMSGTTPLMSTFRQTSTDVFSTLAITELEQESRLLQPAASTSAGIRNELDIVSASQLLPKKAYISSELQHVIDERTPIPMPNVQKIQKYLNTAVEPKVFRHDGKMKLPSDAPVSHIPRPANQSLADLSLASGDISMYTLRDAQQFSSK
ncbi:uncharacterized protein sip2 isoform X1 [Drosophila pseudoobscura]|uniref:Uncharacterized protein sip2 isoform X1 n=2 Tax=Drosophila pseudoobscura pseudoobscura TaxID=46245 RepID=Q29JX0_DROPS|nr:uncharacterized protein LOC4816108 isoform X1 [Drosophila pseudoobscura]